MGPMNRHPHYDLFDDHGYSGLFMERVDYSGLLMVIVGDCSGLLVVNLRSVVVNHV